MPYRAAYPPAAKAAAKEAEKLAENAAAAAAELDPLKRTPAEAMTDEAATPERAGYPPAGAMVLIVPTNAPEKAPL